MSQVLGGGEGGSKFLANVSTGEETAVCRIPGQVPRARPRTAGSARKQKRMQTWHGGFVKVAGLGMHVGLQVPGPHKRPWIISFRHWLPPKNSPHRRFGGKPHKQVLVGDLGLRTGQTKSTEEPPAEAPWLC